MSSYYKTINGVKMDRALLEAADEAVAGRGDGRISKTDEADAWFRSEINKWNLQGQW